MKVRIIVFLIIATVFSSGVSSSVSFAVPDNVIITGSVQKSELSDKGDKLGNDATLKERSSNEKLITVTVIVVFVWLFLGLFLFIIDRKISRLEKMIDEL